MKKIDYKNFSVIIEDEEKFDQLMIKLEVSDIKWGNRIPATQNKIWNIYKAKTVVTVRNGNISFGDTLNLDLPQYEIGELLNFKLRNEV